MSSRSRCCVQTSGELSGYRTAGVAAPRGLATGAYGINHNYPRERLRAPAAHGLPERAASKVVSDLA